MTIQGIIKNGKGTAHAWRVEKAIDNDPYVGTYYSLWHYSTKMATWRKSTRYGTELVDCDLGHGSASDQNGMNTLFRTLNLPYYYSRAGGAEIVKLCTCGRFTFSHQHAPACDGQAIVSGIGE